MTNRNQEPRHPAPRLYKDTYYFPTCAGAIAHKNKLIAWQDATPEARVNSFTKGWAIQEKRSGRYWGEVAHSCPGGGQFIADGWV